MKGKQGGVTLMELLVVMAAIGILAAVAYPTYREQVRRSNRTEARVALEQTAAALEKCYTRYMRYDDSDNCPTANQFGDEGGYDTPRGYYRITAPSLDTTEFTVHAEALGAQATDSTCASLDLDQTGNRTPAACW